MKYAKTLTVRAALAVAVVLSLGTVIQPAKAEVTTVTTAKKKEWVCSNKVANILYRGGFRGENLREAWAIVIRESRGHAKSVSHTHDYGLFQFNRSAHHNQPWWSEKKLLDPAYNTGVAYRISRGGKTWYPWGMDGHGNRKAGTYATYDSFTKYQHYYSKYPCAV